MSEISLGQNHQRRYENRKLGWLDRKLKCSDLTCTFVNNVYLELTNVSLKSWIFGPVVRSRETWTEWIWMNQFKLDQIWKSNLNDIAPFHMNCVGGTSVYCTEQNPLRFLAFWTRDEIENIFPLLWNGTDQRAPPSGRPIAITLKYHLTIKLNREDNWIWLSQETDQSECVKCKYRHLIGPLTKLV